MEFQAAFLLRYGIKYLRYTVRYVVLNHIAHIHAHDEYANDWRDEI